MPVTRFGSSIIIAGRIRYEASVQTVSSMPPIAPPINPIAALRDRPLRLRS